MRCHMSEGLLGKLSFRSLILIGLSVNHLIAPAYILNTTVKSKEHICHQRLAPSSNIWECLCFSYILISLGAPPSPFSLNFIIRQEYADTSIVSIQKHMHVVMFQDWDFFIPVAEGLLGRKEMHLSIFWLSNLLRQAQKLFWTKERGVWLRKSRSDVTNSTQTRPGG